MYLLFFREIELKGEGSEIRKVYFFNFYACCRQLECKVLGFNVINTVSAFRRDLDFDCKSFRITGAVGCYACGQRELQRFRGEEESD